MADMQTTILRNILKHAVCRQIFCPFCDTILDMKKAVLCDLGSKAIIACADCWDAHGKPAVDSLSPESQAKVDISDGRVLWSRKRVSR